MDHGDQVNRRDFIATTAGAASVATGLAGTAAFAQPASKALPPGFKDQIPLQNNWDKPLKEVV